MGTTTMQFLSFSLAVFLSLGVHDGIWTVDGYSFVSNAGNPGYYNPDIPKDGRPMQDDVKLQRFYTWYGPGDVAGPIRPRSSRNIIYSAAVNGGYGSGSYNSQTSSSGGPVTSGSSGSDTRSQLQDSQRASVGSGSLVGSAAGMGMSGYGVSRSVSIQGSDTIRSSMVLMPLQSSDSVPKPEQLMYQIPLQTSNDSVAEPGSQTLVQTISQSSGPQSGQASSGTMAQSSTLQLTQTGGQQLAQASSQSARQSNRGPLEPQRDRLWQTGSRLFSGSRPVQDASVGYFKPLPPKNESMSLPSYQIVQHSSELNSPQLAQASYALMSPSSRQQLAQSSGQQPVQTSYETVAQPSSQQLAPVIQPSSEQPAQISFQSVAQGSSHLAQTSYPSVAQPSVQPAQATDLPVVQPSSQQLEQASSQFVAQPSSQLLEQTSSQSVAQPSSQLAQASYQSVAQASSQQSPQAIDLSVAQLSSQQLPHAVDLSMSRPSIQQPVQDSGQSVAQTSSQQLVQASQSVQSSGQLAQGSYMYVAQPSSLTPFKPHNGRLQFGSKLLSVTRPLQNPSHSSVVQSSSQRPAQVSYQSVSQTVRPQVAQVSSQQSPQASYSVTPPSSLQTALSRYQSVVQHGEPIVFKPLQAQGEQLYQVGSKLYSCQEYVLQPSYQLAAQPGWTEYQPPSRPASPSLAQSIKPVVQPSYQVPVKPGQDTYVSVVSPSSHVPPGPLQSTLQSTFRLAQLPEQPSYQPPVLPSRQPLAKHRLPSYGSVSPLSGLQSGPLRQLQQPGYQPLAKPRQDVYQPLVKPVQSSYKPSSKLEPSIYQPQMLPSHQSLAQSGYSSQVMPKQSGYQAQSSSETISQSGYLMSSMAGQSGSQPQMLPSRQSLAQSGYLSPAIPVRSRYKPQVQSSYETVSQPGFQTSMPGQSGYQSVSRSSSQALVQPSSRFVSSYESASQSVQPGLRYPALNYQPVTNQNAPGPAQSSRHLSQSRSRLLQQLKS
ncbi:paternally-expressed gene 3 protein-like isoform X6 [Sinocyclocheilus grahami]|uniref:paternally-expressed gene 3 protein-like isoform X6 n=1 Tax=Sinocyclocheilus grahami TaxID=75366 RepID=UPI0007AD3BCF|nr:PREDICTED: paternally-expressed gene 3 protein-like isoform X6 [Sinocyclocheilus grahami]